MLFLTWHHGIVALIEIAWCYNNEKILGKHQLWLPFVWGGGGLDRIDSSNISYLIYYCQLCMPCYWWIQKIHPLCDIIHSYRWRVDLSYMLYLVRLLPNQLPSQASTNSSNGWRKRNPGFLSNHRLLSNEWFITCYIGQKDHTNFMSTSTFWTLYIYLSLGYLIAQKYNNHVFITYFR